MAPSLLTGVVLAGGLARRMGGVDKGLQQLDGRPLVEHVLARLAPQVGPLLINANRNHTAYAAYGHPVFADEIPDFAGPLSGLYSALGQATTPWVLTVPCDSPFFPADLAAQLWRGASAAAAPLAFARAGGRDHPVFCLCRTDLRPMLGEYVRSGGRRVMDWCRQAGACQVEFDDDGAGFQNLNTLADLVKMP